MWAPNWLHVFSGMMALQLLSTNSVAAQNYSNRDYCLNSGRIRLLLVDITTEYDQTDKDSIMGMIGKVLSGANGGDFIVVRTISDSYTKSERLVERCIPQCPAQGVVNRLFKCSDGILRTDTANVRQDILAALRDKLTNFQELKYSDIIRTINADAQEEARQGQVLNLYIYSDLIENSDHLISDKDFFRYQIAFLIDALKKFKLIAPLPNSEVQVAGVGRSDAADRQPLNIHDQNFLLEFWKAYFTAGGAANVTISQRARE